MRLHVFVPCGWGDSPVSMQKSLVSPPPGLETDVPLSPELCSTNAASDKRRRKTTAQGAAPSWQPSLRAISEDGNPTLAAAAGVPKRGRSRSSRSKRTTTGTSRTPSHTEPKEFREYEVPILVPAFAPTAFLF